MAKNEPEEFVLIPKDQLSTEALSGLVDEFILREGTDYGHQEAKSLEDKRKTLLNQIQNGKLVIAFSLKEESATLLPADKV